MSVGQDLLDVPLHTMVYNLALAISRGQYALDRTSLETARVLATEKVQLIPEIDEIIEPTPFPVTNPDGSLKTNPDGTPVVLTGARIRAETMAPETYTLLQAGLQPTFYQFTEAQIEVKLSISMKRVDTQETHGNERLGLQVGAYRALAFGSSVNYRTANTYSYSAEGASVLRATMRPVPAPPRLIPRTVTINTFNSPATIYHSD
jgi:hypothetical protein